MDYCKLTTELLEKTYLLGKLPSQKRIGDLLKGELFVLDFLIHNGDVSTPSEIAAALGVSTARIAVVLRVLERKGLLARQTDSSDHRKTNVTITDTGKEIISKRHDEMFKSVEFVLRELGETDAREYIRIVSRVVEISEKRSER